MYSYCPRLGLVRAGDGTGRRGADEEEGSSAELVRWSFEYRTRWTRADVDGRALNSRKAGGGTRAGAGGARVALSGWIKPLKTRHNNQLATRDEVLVQVLARDITDDRKP